MSVEGFAQMHTCLHGHIATKARSHLHTHTHRPWHHTMEVERQCFKGRGTKQRWQSLNQGNQPINQSSSCTTGGICSKGCQRLHRGRCLQACLDQESHTWRCSASLSSGLKNQAVSGPLGTITCTHARSTQHHNSLPRTADPCSYSLYQTAASCYTAV